MHQESTWPRQCARRWAVFVLGCADAHFTCTDMEDPWACECKVGRSPASNVLAAFAAHAVGHHKPMRHGGTLAMSSTSLARGISGRTSTALPVSSTPCTAKTHCKDVLCKVDSNGYDCHDFPSQNKLMKRFASPSWHFVAARRNPNGSRLPWDGEVPFIRSAS